MYGINGSRRELLEKVKNDREKVGLKLDIQKMKTWHLVPSLHGKWIGKQWKQVTDFIFLGSKITANGDCSYEIKDTKGTFHAKMGTIKDRNCMDLTEAEDIKKRWQEYTEELYKKDLHDPDNHDCMISHLEPDIVECEVKWALGSITMNKASGGDGIPVELFKILKDDSVKMLHSYASKFGKLSSGHRTGKISFHSKPKERQCQRLLKLLHNCTPLTR